MKSKKLYYVTALVLASLSLAACSNTNNQTKTTTTSSSTNQIQAKNQDVRLSFNKVTTGTAANNFQGGSTLEQLVALFGQPTTHEQRQAGDATVEAYTWQIDAVSIEAQLYNNSTIAKSISNFSFIRDAKTSLADYQKLKVGQTTYSQAVQLLGEPDVMSHAVSSDAEQGQAIWTSGLKGESGTQIQLTFTNSVLATENQVGLTN
ncbi:DUF3862 domain-containing protein [Streptococcus saliviloxodontae]|uniref:Outer membrane protein assembly factor BamE (Lipoprotein component of BamABCDE complex) n=1 Tax=Streptococcus saliviloxodontae TaxID=1349416 RepID=A0ABS2PQR0_9STRE|nr:DUF3862 domain-containing protein [Streptococcus saliviloxodontae]MBM7637108.1 outer membrane protein assembly factor BamE (lipoprotein component of BamABCDE complex) [Streptococcus saliviloxodontae]